MRRWMVALALLTAGCAGHPERPVTLRLGYDSPPVTLDPVRHDDRVTRSILFSVLEPLVRIGPSLAVEPALADGWDTPDERTWRLHLRPGVLFHDGRPLRVADAVASIRRAMTDPGSAVAGYLALVESVRADGERPGWIVIRTSAPAPLLLTRLALITVSPGGRPPEDGPVGTGPYRWVSGSTRGPIVLERWERYWGRPPDAGRVVIRVLDTEEEVLEAVARGAVDVVDQVTPPVASRVGARRGWRVRPLGYLATGMLGCNLLAPPLDDPMVREAIDLAIDRGRLVVAMGSADKVAAGTLVPPGVLGSLPDHGPRPADPERARELLRRAGHPEGITVTLLHGEVEQQLERELVRQLARAGIAVRAVARPWDEAYPAILAGRAQLFLWSWSFPFGDVSDFLDSAVHSRDPARRLGLSNGTGYADPEVDRWIEAAASELNGKRRLELLHLVLDRVMRDRPYIPLYHRSRLVLLHEPFALDGGGVPWLVPQAVRVRRR